MSKADLPLSSANLFPGPPGAKKSSFFGNPRDLMGTIALPLSTRMRLKENSGIDIMGAKINIPGWVNKSLEVEDGTVPAWQTTETLSVPDVNPDTEGFLSIFDVPDESQDDGLDSLIPPSIPQKLSRLPIPVVDLKQPEYSFIKKIKDINGTPIIQRDSSDIKSQSSPTNGDSGLVSPANHIPDSESKINTKKHERERSLSSSRKRNKPLTDNSSGDKRNGNEKDNQSNVSREGHFSGRSTPSKQQSTDRRDLPGSTPTAKEDRYRDNAQSDSLRSGSRDAEAHGKDDRYRNDRRNSRDDTERSKTSHRGRDDRDSRGRNDNTTSRDTDIRSRRDSSREIERRRDSRERGDRHTKDDRRRSTDRDRDVKDDRGRASTDRERESKDDRGRTIDRDRDTKDDRGRSTIDRGRDPKDDRDSSRRGSRERGSGDRRRNSRERDSKDDRRRETSRERDRILDRRLSRDEERNGKKENVKTEEIPHRESPVKSKIEDVNESKSIKKEELKQISVSAKATPAESLESLAVTPHQSEIISPQLVHTNTISPEPQGHDWKHIGDALKAQSKPGGNGNAETFETTMFFAAAMFSYWNWLYHTQPGKHIESIAPHRRATKVSVNAHKLVEVQNYCEAHVLHKCIDMTSKEIEREVKTLKSYSSGLSEAEKSVKNVDLLKMVSKIQSHTKENDFRTERMYNLMKESGMMSPATLNPFMTNHRSADAFATCRKFLVNLARQEDIILSFQKVNSLE